MQLNILFENFLKKLIYLEELQREETGEAEGVRNSRLQNNKMD